jgi:uncharacterized protein involved in exopolysaccharide biosynthesis
MEKTDIYSEELIEQENPIDWIELLSEFWRRRKFITIFTGGITLITIVIVLILPKQYTSSAVILPDVDKSHLSNLAGISNLAAMAGVNLGGEGSLIQLYPTIIKSEWVLRNVIYHKYKTNKFADSVNLIQYWEYKESTPELNFEVTLKTLQELLDISTDMKLNVITMKIETTDPQLSADILNNAIDELNTFLLTKRTTNASEQRKWIEGRLVEVKKDLERSENALKEFREKNRIVTGSPQLMLEQARLEREVQINNTLYVELKKQYEVARINEIQDIPIVNVMDYARPAAKKSSPKRTITTLVMMFISFIGSLTLVFIGYQYKEKIDIVKAKFPITKKLFN